MHDVRRAAAKLLLLVVVIMAWRAMALRLLKLMASGHVARLWGLQWSMEWDYDNLQHLLETR